MTNKQKAAAEILVGAGGSKTISEAMREAGYSEETIDTPTKLTESKGWAQLREEYKSSLMERGIDGKKLSEKMAEWIDAQKIDHSHTEPDKLVPDYQTQIKAGEMLREDLGLKEEKGVGNTTNVLVIPSELMGKYGITSDAKNSSTR